MLRFLLRLSLLAAVATQTTAIAAASSETDACSALNGAGLGSLLLFPDDEAYAERQASYWAPNAALGPSCILQAQKGDDVARALKVISLTGCDFAVRSGGHSQWAGGSDVRDGVTIDLGLMTNITYDPETTIASLQPGPTWGDVFTALEPYGVAPTGGRDANVGIGGFLTGGGNAYLTGRNGFGCDTVVNFEVALADGSIVNANKTSNTDLWRALKGGWANYGVVTRFDIETTANPEVWALTQIHNSSVGGKIATGFVKVTDSLETYPEAALLSLRTYNTVAKGALSAITLMVDTEGKENPPIFNELQEVPSSRAIPRFATLGEVAVTGIDPSDDRVHWFTLTFNNDVAIVKKAMDVHDALVAVLQDTLGPSSFSTQCILQPLPSFFGEIGVRKGGNMLGLDAVKTNSIMWLGTVAYQDPVHDKVTHQKLQRSFRELEKFADLRGGNVDFRYINYADKTQNPLRTYGKANLDFMKEVAAKYDPQGVFQKQMPGSFKVTEA